MVAENGSMLRMKSNFTTDTPRNLSDNKTSLPLSNILTIFKDTRCRYSKYKFESFEN